eukprot:1440479-Amphidinium_carterae.2
MTATTAVADDRHGQNMMTGAVALPEVGVAKAKAVHCREFRLVSNPLFAPSDQRLSATRRKAT